MAIISWGTFKSLAFFFGPILLPKFITWYQTTRRAAATQQKPIVPLNTRSLFAITLLAAVSVLFAVHTLPVLSPENVFTRTGSNPTSSNNLIFSRLSTLRPLTPADETLHAKFESRASKLLYYKYGGDVLAACPFCTSQDPNTYLVYALPALALPHLLSAAVVGLATSEAVTGRAGAQWRASAVYALAAVAAADAYALLSWDHEAAGNEKARVLAEVYFFHWVSRTYRLLALALVDAGLAVALYLSATNRLFVVPPRISERVDQLAGALGVVNSRVRSANVLKNTISRDAELRTVEMRYWTHEGVVMQEAMESEEVVESMRDAVENRRIDMAEMDRVAETFAQQVMGTGIDI